MKIAVSSVFLLVFLILITAMCLLLVYFIFRTTFYVNYLTNCDADKQFCYIKKIKLSIPTHLLAPLERISETEGTRVEIYKKRQKAVSIQKLNAQLPEIVEWYKTLAPQISEAIGEKVKPTPLKQPNSLSLVVYEKEGDFIDWHFDTNHYNGRFFTLLLPVTTAPTCGNYQYRNANGDTETLYLQQGEAILFEGDRVFHKGKELCKNQRRVVLSCTFTSSHTITPPEAILNFIKNWGIFGEIS
jgi:hypothetical protein